MHWFAVEASISTCTLNVYDSDVAVISDKQLQSFMKSWSTLFPSLLLQSQLFKDDPRLTIPPGAKRCKEFNVHRMPVDSVPQTKVSGDCGVYAIKFTPHSIAVAAAWGQGVPMSWNTPHEHDFVIKFTLALLSAPVT
ncbi:uncharacterized protein LOC133832262 [Humulus lupulus]|uniref:uncharacterized protein LOC133832262 n=1 Tax=Humulus lupulus TaxID=3486 RepID=UPI002B40DABE|nr:uncharacterized protein LOC133832262 [Humulus lupulus]